ncbi:hypothetical protein ACIO93_42550 [Streptomyces sp. NPDC087903]|uniref:hypothetical protein n=1 Tax=Streptomyces sp. NPDC087903 TaxID=3365819 RepID=UPI0038017B78
MCLATGTPLASVAALFSGLASGTLLLSLALLPGGVGDPQTATPRLWQLGGEDEACAPGELVASMDDDKG